jgi:hypothetical protein
MGTSCSLTILPFYHKALKTTSPSNTDFHSMPGKRGMPSFLPVIHESRAA